MPATVPSMARSRPRLLLIDDDEGVRRSLQLLLEGCGFDVRSFGSAIPLLNDNLVRDSDVLITDYLLPDRDGIALLETLRRQGWRGRAILITAFPSASLADRAKASGFAALLAKPLHQPQLIAAIGAPGAAS
jgi:FixJ family two-component response regulator